MDSLAGSIAVFRPYADCIVKGRPGALEFAPVLPEFAVKGIHEDFAEIGESFIPLGAIL
jgi:hypothetical protein